MNSVSITNMGNELSEEDISEYFGLFGPLKEVRFLTEKDTGKSRGFAFVTFCDPFSYRKCISHATHELRGKRVQVSSVDNEIPSASNAGTLSKKLFVSFAGIHDVDEAALQTLFANFGVIAHIELMKERDGSSLYYGIITFVEEESVNRCLKNPITIWNKPLFIRRAIRKEEVKKAEQRERERTERMERIMSNPQASARYFSSVPSLLGGNSSVSNSFHNYGMPNSVRTRLQRDDAYNQVSFHQNYQYSNTNVGSMNQTSQNHMAGR